MGRMKITPDLLTAMGAVPSPGNPDAWCLRAGHAIFVFERMRGDSDDDWRFRRTGGSFHPVTTVEQCWLFAFLDGVEAGEAGLRGELRRLLGLSSSDDRGSED